MPEVVTWNYVVAGDRMWSNTVNEFNMWVMHMYFKKNLVVNVQLRSVLDGVDGREYIVVFWWYSIYLVVRRE